MLIFLLFVVFVVSAKNSTIILVTPSVSLDLKQNGTYDRPLTYFGERQSYLIGRQLRQMYQNAEEPIPMDFSVFTDGALDKAQTASNIIQAFFLAGTGDLVPLALQEKSTPVIKDVDFTEFTQYIRDGAEIYHKKSYPIHAVIDENDLLFNPEKNCVGIYAKLAQNRTECQKSDATKKACQEAKDFCGIDIIKAEDTCHCHNYYRSIKANRGTINPDPSPETVAFLEAKCEDHRKIELTGDAQKLLTENLFKNFKSDLAKPDKLTLYVISELQMKTLIYAMTGEYDKKLPRYGSMITLEREFREASNFVTLKVNLQNRLIDKKELEYNGFVAWINSRMLKDYNKECKTNPTPKPQPEEKKNLLFLIIIIAGAVVVAAGLGVGGFCLYKRLRRSRVSVDEVEAERGARKMQSERKAEEKKARGASEALLMEPEGKADDSGESDAFKSIMSKLDSRKGKKKPVKKEQEQEQEQEQEPAINESVLVPKENES